MNVGMLWFDNDPKAEMDTKIERAAAYYRKKYGCTPDLCFVHPSMLTGNYRGVRGVDVRSSATILPHHFWLGLQQPMISVAA